MSVRLSFVSVLLGCMACTTAPGISREERQEMTGLEEMSLEYIQSRWGEPDSQVPKAEGRTVRYKNIRSEDEEPVSRRVSVKYCDVRLELTKDLLVTAWEYENCRPGK
jgi:hypothetical protein